MEAANLFNNPYRVTPAEVNCLPHDCVDHAGPSFYQS